MKHLILFLFLFLFSFTGCSYLGFKTGSEEAEETLLEDEEFEGEEDSEDSEEEEIYDDEEEEDEEEDEKEDEEDADEDEEDEEEYEEDGEEKSKGGGISGFLKRLFGGDDSDLDEEIIDDEEGYEEEDEEYADEDEEDEEDIAEEESSSDDTENTFVEDTSQIGETPSSPVVSAPVKQNRPLQKIREVPYQAGGYLANAVYIARSNEDLAGISQKIYGSNQSESLYAINPHLKTRSLKVGDKIYYNSPNRPNDQSRILFYYVDIGVTPLVYKLTPGQNIRDISSQLLGDSNSWKEIWATNPNLKSKWSVNSEIMISYWPVGSEKQASAQVEEPPSDPAPPIESENLEGQQEQIPEDQPEEPQLALPEAPPAPELEETKKDYLSLIMKNKGTFAGILGFFVLILLMLKMILNKRRQQREFDYTSSDIKL